MSNNITLAAKYSALLDEVYKQEAKTGILEAASGIVREGNNAHEIMVPKFSMDGLADYSRTSGYVSGDVALEWETKAFNYERGRMFSVDDMDNEETQEIAFGRLAGEFVRTRTVPELDAFRFAELASTANIGTDSGALTTGANIIAALRKATQAMDEAEVGDTERYLFITPTLWGEIEDMDTYKSKAVLGRFAQIITVPQSRFYSAITLYDGTTGGQTAGGYVKGAEAKDLNFMIVHKPATIIFSKHVVSKIITPAENQTADAWKYGYRSYGITKVFDNKVAGIYAHLSTT